LLHGYLIIFLIKFFVLFMLKKKVLHSQSCGL